MTISSNITSVSESTTDSQTADNTFISINDLIIGRTLHSPIHDENGVLLLAEGSVITAEIKKSLRQRSNKNLKVSTAEANRITLNNFSGAVKPSSIVTFDSELTKKLDTIIDGGLLSVQNKGPQVKESIVFLGRKGFDQEQRDKLISQHNRNGKALGSMMTEALHGESLDGSLVSAMATEYLKEMTTDTDNVLTSVMGQNQGEDQATRSLESSLLAMAIGIEMGLDAENISNLGVAGLVHDWGMMQVPKEVRTANRKLNQVEMLEIKKHPIHSLEILQRVSALPRVVSVIAYQVHEKINGLGYPRGRRGNSIHLFARILQVADAYSGMTSERPYRPPMMRYAAMECLIRMAKEKSVDPDVVRALLKIQSLFPIGSFIILSDGSVAQVIRRNQDKYTQPIVRILQDFEGNQKSIDDDSSIIDLAESELTVQQAMPTPGTNEVPFCEDYYSTSMDVKK